MKITIELYNIDKIEKNIEALQRAINGKGLACDITLLHDILWILKGIMVEYNKLEEIKHKNDCPFCKAGLPLRKRYDIAEVNGNGIPTGRFVTFSGKTWDKITEESIKKGPVN